MFKSAFCLSTSLKAPCWRFPILAMTMFEQARHCSFGLTKTFFFVPRKVRFLAMTMFEQARRCSFGLTKTFVCKDRQKVCTANYASLIYK